MNTCEEKTSKTGTKSGTRSKTGTKAAREKKTTRERPVTFLAATCEGPYVPAVSSDCGIDSTIVRLWSTRPAGTGAPWGISRTVWLADCDCDCGDSFFSCD